MTTTTGRVIETPDADRRRAQCAQMIRERRDLAAEAQRKLDAMGIDAIERALGLGRPGERIELPPPMEYHGAAHDPDVLRREERADERIAERGKRW